MNALIISDLHLTESINEEYRWMVFNNVRQYLKEYKIPNLFILGDLLDKKDRHPAELVNRLINELVRCTDAGYVHVTILKGNHDYLKPEHPFLDFLDHLDNITWVDKPQIITNDLDLTLWLPHSKTPEVDWKDLDYKDVSYIFMHQSVIGCKVSNMFEMNHGLNLKWLTSRTNAKIYSGDIHVPQDIDSLTYIGTPHPVAFGDHYQPRMLHLTDGGHVEIPLNTIQRLALTVTSLHDLKKQCEQYKAQAGDHLKLKIQLSNKELSQWSDLKQLIQAWCQQQDLKLFDITLEKQTSDYEVELKTSKFRHIDPFAALEEYTQQEQLDAFTVQLGKDLLTTALQK
jgi:hypothetical protein